MTYDLRKELLVLALIGCLLLISSFFFIHQAQAADFSVVISELAWAGSSYSANDEFIELKNLTDREIDLSGWKLTKLSGGQEQVMIEFPPAAIIESENFFVISNFGSEDSVLNIEPDLADSAVSLSNSNLEIKLYDSAGILIDVAGDGSAPFYGDNEFKASMVRNFTIGSGEIESSWSGSLISENLDADAPDFASPAAENFLGIDIIPAADDLTAIEEESVASDDEVIIENFASDDETISEDMATQDALPDIIEDAASDDQSVIIEDDTGQAPPIAGKLLINEIAFKEDQDWVELAVAEQGNFKGWKIFQGESLISEINQDSVYPQGSFILINLDKNLTGTDNVIVVRNENYEIEDTALWSNHDGKFTKSKAFAVYLVETEQWLTKNDFEKNDEVSWISSDELKAGMSLARVSDIDTNSGNDWIITAKQTPGQENEICFASSTDPVSDDLNSASDASSEDLDEAVLPIDEPVPVDVVGKIVINEVLSQPESGQPEWVEIYNLSAAEIEVTDFYLQEGSGTKFKLKGKLPAKKYMVVNVKNLNNAGDLLQLHTGDGQLLDQMVYGSLDNTQIDFDFQKIVLPYALIRDRSGFWKLTTLPTPGSENIFQEMIEEKESQVSGVKAVSVQATSSSKKTAQTVAQPIVLTRGNVDSLEDDDLVYFAGTVTVTPGLFLKQRMYAQNEDIGVEIYFNRADWPNLKIGQQIRVSGKFAAKDLPQIKIYSTDDIQVLGSGEAELKEFKLADQENLIGFLTAGDGEVSEKLAGGFNLVTAEGDVPVCFRQNAKLDTGQIENGQRIFVSGILLPYKDSVCLYPRIDEDMSILPSAAELAAPISESVPLGGNLPAKSILTVAAGVLAGGLGVITLIKKLKSLKKISPLWPGVGNTK
ncbi:MAG: lamin tail domain-containing protein [Patescibacteria group bacterium]